MTNPTETIVFSARIIGPSKGPLDMTLSWGCPVFDAVDGIGEINDLVTINGQVVAIGHITSEGPQCVGSGAMIGAGLLLTATHVLDELAGKDIFAFSFVEKTQMRIWSLYDAMAFDGHVESIPGQLPRSRRSDVAVASCFPISEHANKWPLVMGEVEITSPSIGERVWTLGYRQEGSGDDGRMTILCSSGRVTAYLLHGRGDRLPGPVVEVDMDAQGGMSGGPVFNEAGHIIGIVSTSIGWSGGHAPTYVSLAWTAALSEVVAPWPEDYWPDGRASIQSGATRSLTRLFGSAKQVNRVLTVEPSVKGKDYILKRLAPEYARVLVENRERLEEEGDNDFYHYLEQEGEAAIRALSPDVVVDSIFESSAKAMFKGASKFETDCMEGCEDTEIHSIEMLESGSLSIDVTYNLRGFVITATLNRFDFEERRQQFEDAVWCWEADEGLDSVEVVCGVRPYLRVGLTLSPSEGTCDDFSVYALRLRFEKLRKPPINLAENPSGNSGEVLGEI